MTDFEKQMAFIMELDKIKKITRQTYLSDGSRKENDAEVENTTPVLPVALAYPSAA